MSELGRSASRLRGAYRAALLLLVGCSAPPVNQAEPQGLPARLPDVGCVVPAGMSNTASTIADTVAMINALPKPLTLACFLQSLARPLAINGTNSTFSAQPAQGRRSPRIFLFQDPNVMSIVPEGPGAELLEFGETRPGYRSLKAEIQFPVSAQLAATAPFEGFMFTSQITTCAVCHAAESDEPNSLGIREFTTQALRPLPRDNVSAASLEHELAICDAAVEPERCALLDGLLGYGTVTDRDFPAAMATFGSN